MSYREKGKEYERRRVRQEVAAHTQKAGRSMREQIPDFKKIIAQTQVIDIASLSDTKQSAPPSTVATTTTAHGTDPSQQSELPIASLLTAPVPVSLKNGLVVEIKNGDTLDTVMELCLNSNSNDKWKDALILNMASDFVAGGGWLKGSSAQEEQLFYRTTYFLHTECVKYPLSPGQAVYSPGVFVFKSSEANGFQVLANKDRFSATFLAMPAIRKPKISWNDYARASDKQLMRAKIHAIFQIAIAKGHTKLVLGALGCGAFANPPEAVAKLFYEAIQLYGSHFDGIVFAIYEPKDTSDSSNHAIFKRVFQTKT